MTRPDLFPRPRHVAWSDGWAPLDTPMSEQHDPTLPGEGYRLTVGADGIELVHADENGRRYGHQTLGQLTTADGIATATIDDHPDIAVRGHMLDISRDRVPTRATLELLVERLAACRYNHLQLYTEHTFAYADHEVVWAEASPMTPDDMRWLDDLCADHGIELAANQNTFGHMARWLIHDEYRDRAETPESFESGHADPMAASLAPTDGNARFALALVRELAATVRSRRVNIGCDEIFELGQGASADDVAERGKTAVFVDHLRRLALPLVADGFEVQFWADMLERDIAIGRDLADAGAIAVVWGYSPPIDIDPDDIDLSGLPDELREVAADYLANAGRGFGPRLERFAESGFRYWVAPGTSGWNSFVGRHTNARANIIDAVDAAIEHGADGMLNTEWGDNGHLQPPFATLPALAYGGAASWCRATNGDIDDEALAESVDRHLLGGGGGLAAALVGLATVEDHLGVVGFNGAPFFYGIVVRAMPVDQQQPDPAATAAAVAHLDAAVTRLDGCRPGAVDGEQLVAETRLSADLVRHGIRRLAGEGGPELDAELAALAERHRTNWLARSRPGGLDDSVGRLRPGVEPTS